MAERVAEGEGRLLLVKKELCSMLDEVKGLMEVYLSYNSLTATTTLATVATEDFVLKQVVLY